MENQTILIHLNGEPHTLKKSNILKDLINTEKYSLEESVVAINCKHVPRSEWSSVFLQNGDQIDVLTPIEGG